MEVFKIYRLEYGITVRVHYYLIINFLQRIRTLLGNVGLPFSLLYNEISKGSFKSRDATKTKRKKKLSSNTSLTVK